jgi:hypothetical protein
MLGDQNSLTGLPPPCRVALCCWFVGLPPSMEQMSHTLLKVVARLPCRSIAPVGSTLLTCGSGPCLR